MFHSNNDHSAEEDSDQKIPQFLRLPLTRSESYSSVDSIDSLSLFIGDFDELTKTLFSGNWIDDETPSQIVLPLAQRSRDAGVMELIDQTLTVLEQNPFQLDNIMEHDTQPSTSSQTESGRIHRVEDTEQGLVQFRIEEEKGLFTYNNQKTRIDSSHHIQYDAQGFRPKRIPRRRQRIKNPRIAQTECLIDQVRAGVVTLLYLLITAILYSQSIWDKLFVWKAMGVFAISYLSTVPLDDPRGDKANVVTIAYSRKTALLIIYIWIWISAVDWTTTYFTTFVNPYFTEWNISPKDHIRTLERANINDHTFPSETATNRTLTAPAFDFHEFIAVMEKAIVKYSKPSTETELASVFEESGFVEQSTFHGRDTQSTHDDAHEREFNIRGHTLTHGTKSLRTIKIVTKPSITKRPLLRTRKDEGMDEDMSNGSVELDDIDANTIPNSSPSTDVASPGDSSRIIGFVIMCNRVLTLLNEMQKPLCNRFDCVLPADNNSSVLHINVLQKSHRETLIPNMSNKSLLSKEPLAKATDEIASFEMGIHSYVLERFPLLSSPLGRQIRAGVHALQKFLSFLFGNGGGQVYQEISYELAEYWHSFHW